MHRFTINSFKLLASMVVVAMVSRATAADIGGLVPTTTADVHTAASADRHLGQATAWPPDRVAAESTSSQPPRAFPYPERTASTTANAVPRPLAARRLPLSPPSPEAPGSKWSNRLTPLETGAASLGIVVGLFLLVVWVARRGTPNGASRLPYEAVEVLGRAPLAGRQHVHLVRCGNKLLLVCILPTGAQTLTEITDPAEVDRLVGVCYGQATSGSSFRQLLQRLGGSRRQGSTFYDDRESAVDFAHLDAVQHGSQEAGV